MKYETEPWRHVNRGLFPTHLFVVNELGKVEGVVERQHFYKRWGHAARLARKLTAAGVPASIMCGEILRWLPVPEGVWLKERTE
jgi:hypothetical protein